MLHDHCIRFGLFFLVRVFIDGEEQSLESRQTKLRDRYLELDESEKPLAYKR